MREIECDVAVIGAGTAGIAAHRAALAEGARSVLIERGPGGTTCARVGCMPSKLLIAAGAAAQDAREAGLFGIGVTGLRVDGRAVLDRVRAERDRFVASVRDELAAFPAESRIAGAAAFTGARSLRVDDRLTLRFRAAVIATGSSPSVPEPVAALGEAVLTTDTLFEIADLPGSIAVLGAGPVGLEMAQALARLAVETTLLDPAAALGGLGDPDLCEAARAIFGRGLALRLGAGVEGGEPQGEGVRLYWRDGEGRPGEGRFDRVLAAAGRPPNLAGLELDAADLRQDDHGMPEFDARSLRCGRSAIFIAGDANHDRPVLHEAARQGRIAGRNAAALARGAPLAAPERWVPLAIVFSDPQIARIGAGHAADAAGERVVGRVDFCDQGRARIMGRAQGGARIYADRSGRLLGAEMLGPGVEHLAHILALAIGEGLDAAGLRDRPFYHPTLEEGLTAALSDIVAQTGG